MRRGDIGLYERGVTAKAGKFVRQPHDMALSRQHSAVAPVIGQRLADRGRDRGALLLFNEHRGVGVDIGDLRRTQIVTQTLAQVLVVFEARIQSQPGILLLEVDAVALSPECLEDIETGGKVAVEEIRLGKAELKLLDFRAESKAQAALLALTQEIPLGERKLADETLGAGKSTTDRKRAGRLFLHLDIDDHLVVGRSLGLLDLHLLEESEVAQPLTRAAESGGVEGIALGQAEFASEHPVKGSDIAFYIYAFDEDTRRFADLEGDSDGALFAIAFDAGIDVDKSESEISGLIGQTAYRRIDQLGVVPLTLFDLQRRRKLGNVEFLQPGRNSYRTKTVPLPFLEGESDKEVPAVSTQLRHRRDHPEVGESLILVKPKQQFAVEGQEVGIVNAGAGQETQRQIIHQAALLRLDDRPQSAVGESLVADEADFANLGRRALVDFEDKVHAILRLANYLGFDPGGETSVGAVKFHDPLHIVLHARTRIDLARRQLDLAIEGFVV